VALDSALARSMNAHVIISVNAIFFMIPVRGRVVCIKLVVVSCIHGWRAYEIWEMAWILTGLKSKHIKIV